MTVAQIQKGRFVNGKRFSRDSGLIDTTIDHITCVECQDLRSQVDHQLCVNLILSASCEINRMLVKEKNIPVLIENTCDILTSITECRWAYIHTTGIGTIPVGHAFSGPQAYESYMGKLQVGHSLPAIIEKMLGNDDTVIVAESTVLDASIRIKTQCIDGSVLCRRLISDGSYLGYVAICIEDRVAKNDDILPVLNQTIDDVCSTLATKIDLPKPGYFETLFSKTHWPMAVISEDYSYLLVNQAFASLFDSLPDSFLGQPVGFKIGKHAISEILKPLVDRCMSSRRPVSHTMIIDILEGAPWYELTLFPYQENDIQGVLLHAMEVSGKRRREQQLIKNTALLEDVFLDSPVSMAVISCEDNSILYVNKAACEDCGVNDPKELEGKILFVDEVPFRFFYADNSPLSIEKSPIVRALSGVETRNVELIIERKDRTRRWGLISTVPLYNVDGDQIAVLWVSPDITDRKKAERKLADTNSLLKNVIDQSLIPMILLEAPGGELLYANNAASEAAGVTNLKELTGKVVSPGNLPFRYFLPGSDKELPYNELPLVKTLRHIESRNKELIVERSDGSVRNHLTNAVPIYNEENELIAGFSAYIDITQLRKMEQEQKQLEKQIMHAQKLESIGRLAGGVAHDLNNLLSPILGYSEMSMVNSHTSIDTHLERFTHIHSSAKKARDLIRQLLAFSRKQQFDCTQVDINEVLVGFKKLIRGIFPENIAIELKLDHTINPIHVDKGQMEQIIMNLSVNAADAMPEGGTLTIETAAAHLDKEFTSVHTGSTPGDYVMIGLSDTGSGMDEETSQRIFEPFFSTKGEMGTGLGLATVYGIVKQHKGNIWVYSELGHGTLFKVYIPVSRNPAVELKTEKPSVGKLQGDETILLVEDDQGVRIFAKEILEKYGYHVLTAECGEDALQVLKQHGSDIDLLLTDVIMPNMNGVQLSTTIKKLIPGIKVLYMSGYTKNILATYGVKSADAMLVQKPFTLQSLVVKVRNLLDL